MVVGDAIRRIAKDYPDKIGLIFGDKKFRWKEVNHRANGLARGFLEIGLKRQDKIAIIARNCHQYVETYLAVAKAGLICVPLNTWLVRKELSYIIENSEATTLIVDQNYKGIIESVMPELKGVENFIGIGEEHGYPYDFEALIQKGLGKSEVEADVREDDIFVLGYTGGTTGLPKGVVLTHRNACTAALIDLTEWRIIPNYVCLSLVPLFFIGGWMGSTLIPLMRGCTVVFADFEPQKVLQTIEKEKVNHTAIVPTMLNMLINYPDIDKYDLRSLRSIIIPGAPSPLVLLKKALEKLGPIFFIPYGATETCVTGPILQKEEVHLETKNERRLSSIGKAMIGIEVRIVKEDGNDVIPGSEEAGELIIKGGSVTKEYWKLPEKTAEEIKDGWWYSGDLAKVDEDGYIYIVDRKKDMIISGGFNIYPREIEEALYTHPAVLHAAVIGAPDEKWGEAAKAIIVLKEGIKVREEEILEFCKEMVGPYKRPKYVEFVDTMPMSSQGKILKRELRERYWKGRETRVI